jgi:lantibiotic modifying enzyme
VDSDKARVQDPNLYDGLAGCLVFLSGMSKVTEDAIFSSLTDFILASLDTDCVSRLPGIGGLAGKGSLVYALTVAAQLLNRVSIEFDGSTVVPCIIHDPFFDHHLSFPHQNDLFQRAFSVSEFITADEIEGDTFFDVVAGSAGCILALCALHTAGQDALPEDQRRNLLATAIACGHHLIKHSKRCPTSGGIYWARASDLAEEREARTGFSHGGAGYALALSVLYKHTSEAAFQHAADGALRFEDSHYCSK